MTRITQTTELTTMSCGQCGVPFAIPEFMRAEKQESGGTWYCPNGHPRVYGECDSDKYRKERDAAIRARDLARVSAQAAQDQARAARRQVSTLKGQLTRARKRAGAGVCPVPECHRTVKQLADHMATKHPDYQP